MHTQTSSMSPTHGDQGGWFTGTSALGHITLTVLAFGAAALFWKQLPDLRRYMKMRSM
ncbi:MAG TPA: hypothetical protein VFJ96_13955 [Gemmatimonadaceae bacterium]|nr:hypothetical protein [Gemmatimonadaceae bacterium]